MLWLKSAPGSLHIRPGTNAMYGASWIEDFVLALSTFVSFPISTPHGSCEFSSQFPCEFSYEGYPISTPHGFGLAFPCEFPNNELPKKGEPLCDLRLVYPHLGAKLSR